MKLKFKRTTGHYLSILPSIFIALTLGKYRIVGIEWMGLEAAIHFSKH